MNITTCLNTSDRKRNSIIFKLTVIKKQIKIFTGISATLNEWSAAHQKLKPNAENYKEINLKLDNLRTVIKNELSRIEYSPNEVKEVCKQIVKLGYLPPHLQRIKTEVKPQLKVTPVQHITPQNTIIQELNYKNENETIDKTTIQDVILLYHDKNKTILSAGRLRHFKSVANLLEDASINDVTVDNFSTRHFEKFRDHQLNKGNSNDTVNNKIKLIKATLRDYNPSHPALLFKNIKQTTIKHPIINKKEFDIILNTKAPLTKSLQDTRDVFLFSCYTGQRIDDILNFDRMDIKDNKWQFRQGKTKKEVATPLNEKCMQILEKHNYTLNMKTQQKYNESLKKLFEKLHIDREVKITQFKGNKEETIVTTLDKIVSSHMGRRFFITNSLLEKKPLSIISKITGQTLKILQQYDQTEFSEIDKHY